MKIGVVGAGWAGLAAAVAAVQAGHQVTVFEAARTLGGRARTLRAQLPDGRQVELDNGQHILIAAYTETLELLQQVGVDPAQVLHRQTLQLRFPDGSGLRLPRLPQPLDLLAGIISARGWPWREKLGLLRAALGWRQAGFTCAPALTVAQLCEDLGPTVRQQLIDPLCVSALNTPAATASAAVFLRVLHDALFAVAQGSQLLLPRVDLSALLPLPAQHWLAARGCQVHSGRRIARLQAQGRRWRLDDELFDAVLLACSSTEAARLVDSAGQDQAPSQAAALRAWAATADALPFEAIATVYAWSPQARLPAPILALPHQATEPAQFVFDRGQLGGPPGLLAFVISASRGERTDLQTQVLQQARRQLQLDLQAVQTVVEKRATFACTPELRRPAQAIAPGLLACADYVAGPYPATLEGAVRSARAAVAALQTS